MKARKVIQIHPITLFIVNIYESASCAEEINNLCKVGKRKTAGGFIWRYK